MPRNPLTGYSGVELTSEAFRQLEESIVGRIQERSTNICTAIQNSTVSHYLQAAQIFKELNFTSESYYQSFTPASLLVHSIDAYVSRNWVLDTLKGNAETTWPDGLPEFLEALQAQDIDAFYCELLPSRVSAMFARARELAADPANDQHVESIIVAALLLCFKSARLEFMQQWVIEALELCPYLSETVSLSAAAKVDSFLKILFEKAE